MFIKKIHVDIKKSTLKIQDVKKDCTTRFKHLKIILDNVDIDEAKGFFEGNFSHIYFILYDCFVTAETNLRQRELSFHLVHKAHREELEQVLHLLEKVLTLLPELLNRRWQCHSIARILRKLLHPGNSWKLRRQAIRYFILWYQTLGDNAPEHIHQMFASLIPGFTPHPSSSSIRTGKKPDLKKDRLSKSTVYEETQEESYSHTIFHDVATTSGPVSPVEVGPILPPQSGEKPLDNETIRFLEALLDFMVTQVIKIEWRDKSVRQYRSFQFLLEQFKSTYLRWIFPNFSDDFSLYKPNLDLPTMRKPSQDNDNYGQCKVVLIKWLASFTQVKKDSPVVHISQSVTPNEEGTEVELRRVSVTQNDSGLLSPEISMSQENTNYDDNAISAIALAREVLYGSRSNVNFIHELYRQAFLLDFTYAGAIRKAIGAYKDWIQTNELPPFMLEPLEYYKEMDDDIQNYEYMENEMGTLEHYKLNRLRNDSYLGAIHRENLFIRAGLQNVLQVFITHASNVFFLECPGVNPTPTLYEEQNDSCKRVLNVYRYVVMHTRLESTTWEQLLRILLQITSLVLGEANVKRNEESIGKKLAPAIFQTLIVTWIKANLNVVISMQLWDQFLQVLTSLTQWEELIREWTKTLDTLTRVLARHVYNLDLNDLPLDRLSEQKSKRKRIGGCRLGSVGSAQPSKSIDQEKIPLGKTNVVDHRFQESRKMRHLSRSISDNSLYRGKLRARSQRSRANINSEISVLPHSVEQDMARILSSTLNDNWECSKSLYNRRSKSLDSILMVESEPPTPRCPSPTPSSGVDSNKDSPIQIENIDGSSIDTTDTTERRSVMAGGEIRGWLPDVAVVLWRRMLSALGDVNNIQDPVLHGQVMEYLVKLTQTLIKIRLNQGVSRDNQTTSSVPELIPPSTVVAPWCFKAIQLPQQYETGKLAAYRLICMMTVQPLDVRLPKEHLTLLYHVIHNSICMNDTKILYAVVQNTGPRLFSLNLPGSSLLFLDFIQAANIILTSQDIQAPRTEAISILGSLLPLSSTMAKLPVLQPGEEKISTTSCPYAKDHIVAILMRSSRKEMTGVARCIALSSLAMFVYRELTNKSSHRTIPEAISILLLALRARHPTVAQVACDCLQLLCDKADVLLELYPNVPAKIIQNLSETLGQTTINEKQSTLTISMLFCLGEWAMHLGPSVLLQVYEDKYSLLTLFTVLDNIIHNRTRKNIQDITKSHHYEFEDFNPNITLDNLTDDIRKSSKRNNVKSIQLAAKMVLMHLVNHLGHFPMGIGAARLSSTVVEFDDLPDIDGHELSSAIFQSQSIQLLMLSNSVVMSLIELDSLDAQGGKFTSGLNSAPAIVRVLLRDLTGKASWDSSILYNQSSIENHSLSSDKEDYEENKKKEELCSNISIQNSPPRHTLRHREPHILPTFTNAASDMDNLDDLLQFIGHSSPEVLMNPEVSLNSAANSPQGLHLESDTIATILNQRNLVREHVSNWSKQQISSMSGIIINPMTCHPPLTPFHHCRLLFSHLGLSGWEQRQKLHLLEKNEKLLRELRNLDNQRSRETHKIAVIYVSHGQEDKNTILNNVTASKEYESFVARLAWEVELESHTGFLGGLVHGKSSGVTAPYFASSFTEIIFHVATRMPSDSPESLLQKTRHLGNDEIHIVWSEHWRDYRRDIIPTEFCDVLIVIYPLSNKLYRIQISRKSEIPYFGPLYNECIVEDETLPGLVRAMALSGSRAKRSTLCLYQHYYEERARSLDTIMRNHKEATTFEQFAAKVYSPVQSKNLFSCTSSISGSTSSMQSTTSSNLAAALIDSQQGKTAHRNSSGNSDSRTNKVSDGSRVWFSHENQEGTALHGISPRPVKKMSFKSVSKQKGVTQITPPDSPRYK